MKNRDSSNKTTNKPNLHFKNVLTGVHLDEGSESALKYINFLARKLAIEQITFLYVAPFYNQWALPYVGNPITGYPLSEVSNQYMKLKDEGEIRQLRKDLEKTVARHWKAIENPPMLSYQIREGSPLEEFIEEAKEQNADILVFGKSTDTGWHQISGKNLIRQTQTNVLLVPDNATAELKRIIVPFDFSENSIRALQLALAIKNKINNDIPVKVINIYEVPYFSAYNIGLTAEQFARDIEDRHEESFKAFLEDNFPESIGDIEKDAIPKGDKSIADHLLENANQSGDLIVMGAKGHSKLELLLLGSTTERLLGRNQSIPTLIVQ